jgi:hypothetical protein
MLSALKSSQARSEGKEQKETPPGLNKAEPATKIHLALWHLQLDIY